ncbi:MAG: ABC transporter permease [Bacilli bacterium]
MDMAKYIFKRLGLMLITFLIILTVCFFLVRCLPVSSVGAPGSDAENIFQAQREALGYNKPLLEQYWLFWVRLFTGDAQGSHFGYSFHIEYMKSPWDLMIQRFPPTILINIYTMLIGVPLGILIGIFMALKKNKWEDHVLSIVIMLVISVPSFIYAFFLQYLFGTVWGILDINFAPGTDWFSPAIMKSMILPVMAMCFGTVAGFGRYVRAELTEVLTSDFMLLARTKGLTRFQATVRHAFRNSLVPIFPMILGEFIGILSGSLIIEQIFDIPGVGKLFIQSINQKDYDVFLFVAMFYVIIGLVGGLIVDLSYGLVDPRIRMGGKK